MKKAWNRMIALLLCLLMVSLEAASTVQVHAYEPDEAIEADEGVVAEAVDEANDSADSSAQSIGDEAKSFVFVPGYIEVPGDRETTELDTDKDYIELRADLVETDGDGDICDELLGVDVDLSAADDAAYPAGYDQQDEIISYFNKNFSRVRNQNPYGSCWAHSAISLCEFYMASHVSGINRTGIDYSELHLVHYDYTQGTPSIAGNTGDKVKFTSETDLAGKLDAGGNLLYAAQTLLCQRGVAAESVAPYPALNTDPVAPGSGTERQDCAYLKNAYKISMSNTNLVKQAIVNNGIVGISLNWQDDYYNKSTNAFYCPEGPGTNHAVAIVGWDDSYPAASFITDPGSNGAWLVRNSWNYEGTGFFSEYQYFWMSYADKSLTENAWVYEMATDYKYDNHYYYDSQIHDWSNMNYGDGSFYSANVYKVAEDDGKGEVLKAVGFGVNNISPEGTHYQILIYTDLKAGGDPSTGKLYSAATTEGVINFNGYYTIPLKESVPLKEGECYAVVLNRLDSVSADIEWEITGKTNGVSAQVGSKPGQSFYSSNGIAWGDNNSKMSCNNYVLSAYTTNSTSSDPTPKTKTPTASPASGSKIAIGSSVTLSTQTTGAKIYYTLNGSTPSTSSTLYSGPITVGESYAGQTLKIKAIAVKDGYDNSGVAEFNYTVNNSQARVELSKTSIKLEKKGATETLTATVYKADGTVDSSASVSYKSSNTNAATVSSSGVVTAVANGNATITATSGQMNATCLVTVDIPKTKTPTANPAGGSKIAIGSSVTLSTQTTGAKIYYTLNGSTPSTSSTLYTGPITVSESYAGQTLKIKAIAVKDGYDNSDIAEFSYTVNNSQARIELSKDSIKLEKKGATLSLTATVYKADGTVDSSASVSYKSSNTNVATVSSFGVVTAVANGNATITATSGQMNATCLVTVDIPKEKVESPTANPASGSELAIGNKVVLGCKTEGAKIYYTKDGKDPASYGTLYSSPIEIGETDAGKSITIRAYAKKDGCDDSDPVQFKYTVKEDQARIELSKDSIKLEEKDATETLKATVYKADGSKDTSASVSYKSSNTKVATVSQTGVVTAVENGEATITATSGELSATCLVTVEISKEKVEAPTANPASGKKIAIGSSISLSTLTDGAKIYYTLDGSEPSSTKTLYSKPITIEKEHAGQTLKIKAIALKEDFEDSDISEFEYTMDESQARIELSKDSIKFEEKDATEKLTAIVYGADGKEDKEAVVNYRSSNSRIASVSNDGIVTAGENGVATITATYEELTAECIVTVDVKEEEPEPEPEEDKEFKVEGISDGGYPYTGLAITPSVSVYYGDTLLSEGTDYKLGYKNNKLASDGAPEVNVTLAGNYSGTINVPFKILKKNITDQDVVVANTTSVYNGKSQKLKPALYYMGKAVSNKEYRIIGLSSSGYKEPGDYPITFTAEPGGNFTGTINTNISIKENTDMIDLAKAAFRLDDPSFSFVYDGNPKEPVYVANGLDRKDYYISYSNNVAIGKATAMISAVPGSGSCYGTKTINFKITKPPVINISNDSNVRISLPDDPVPYAAGGACPKVSVTYAGEPLTEGADYKVSYRNNKNRGQAYVVITGKGAYKGKKEKPFTISKQNLDNLTLIASDVIYSNKIYAYQKTKLTLTDKDGKVLKAGKDYVKFKLGAASEGTVFKSPSSTPEVGSRITVTLTGTGNYTGDITATYYVIEKGNDLSKAKVKILATPEYKDGDPVTLKKEQIQVVFNGKTLSSGDFDIVSYSNNIKAGKGAKVTIRGKGIYGGLKTVGFTIAPKNYK